MDKETTKKDNRVFTSEDMYKAFKHGREFKKINFNGKDMNIQLMSDREFPFWEWLNKYYCRKEIEIISGRVRAYVDDWPRIRRLEKQLIGQRRADMDIEELERKGVKLTWDQSGHA